MEGDGGVGAVLGALNAAVDAVTDLDLTTVDDADIRELALGLLTIGSRMQGETSRVLQAFHVRGLCDVDGFSSTKAWLQAFGRLSGAAAARQVRAVRITAKLTDLAASWQAGSVSAEHVDRIARLDERLGGDVAEQAEPILVPLAEQVTPELLQQACDHITTILDEDGAKPDPVFERRTLSVSRMDGMWLLRGQFDPEAGAIIQAGLEAFSAAPNAGEHRDAGQRRADAMTEAFRQVLRSGAAPRVAGSPAQVGVLLPVEWLPMVRPGAPAASTVEPPDSPEESAVEAGSEAMAAHAVPAAEKATSAGTDPPWLDHWGPISRQTAERILCDCEVFRIILDPSNGLPLDLGRSYRFCPPWLRKALWARDRGCRWPGCTVETAWTDAHHVQHWAQHGPTSISNLVLLCRTHHVRVHEGRWKIDHDPVTGEFAVTRPNGQPYEIRRTKPWTTSHRTVRHGGLDAEGRPRDGAVPKANPRKRPKPSLKPGVKPSASPAPDAGPKPRPKPGSNPGPNSGPPPGTRGRRWEQRESDPDDTS